MVWSAVEMSLGGGLICKVPHCLETESSMMILWSLLLSVVTEIMEVDRMPYKLSGRAPQVGRTASAHSGIMRSNPVKIPNTYFMRGLTLFYNCLPNCLSPQLHSDLQEGKSCISLSYYCISTNWCNAWYNVGTQHTVNEWIKLLVYATWNVVSKLSFRRQYENSVLRQQSSQWSLIIFINVLAFRQKIIKTRKGRLVIRTGIKDGAVSEERVQSMYLGT